MLRALAAIIALILSVNAAAAAYTCDARFYQTRLNTTSNLYQFNRRDLTTGGARQWTVGSTTTLNGLGYNKADGYFYALNYNNTASNPTTVYNLYKLDSTGIIATYATTIPTGDQIAAATVDANGVMYVTKLTNNNNLYRFQLPSTPGGTPTQLPNLPLSPAIPTADMAFNPVDGKLYVVHTANIPTAGQTVPGSLYSIVPSTGAVTTISTAGPTVSATNALGSAFFDISGTLYAYQNGGVFGTVNLTNGNFTYLNGASSASQSDGASCVFPDQNLDVVKSVGTITANSATSFDIPYTVTVKNTGTVSAPNLQLTENLSRSFTGGSPTISIVAGPTVTAGSATANTAFNGTTDTRLLSGNTALAVGSSVTVTLTARVVYTSAASVPSGTVQNNTVYATSASTGAGGEANAGYTFPGGVPLPPPDVLAIDLSTNGTTPVDRDTPTPTPVSFTDLAVSKTDSVGSVNAGATTTYTIRVTNNGPSSVTGATLTDAAVTGLNVTGVACSGTPGQCTAGTTPTTSQLQAGYALPTLTSGQFYELRVTGTITAVSGSVANTATVTPPNGVADTNTANNTASDVNTVAAADVTITKTGPAYAKPGGDVTYTLTVSNSGAVTAAAVSVTDMLPPNVTYKSSAPAATVSGQNLTWSLGSLASGASQILTVVVTAPSTATLASTPAARTLTNKATVSTTTLESNPDNTATAVTWMVAAKLTKSVKNVTQNTTFGTSGGGLPGEVLEYCIDFENIGGAALPNFVVTDEVPGNTTAQLTGFDADELSAATGFGVKLTRGTTKPTTSYFTSAADTDDGALSSTGGSAGRGTMTVNLGALTVGDQGSVCFRTSIR
ncbi:DUF11 domain-containing protein [Deinococcus daejeonensis]|uniref:DUF11 domain-containing protein n=1 Tax=Deinococcus daejeonensis TaxID=1007098 RepID=UPI00166EAE7B|nr:DUF11 domain-containing protein [Deinococcus daejeonensis]